MSTLVLSSWCMFKIFSNLSHIQNEKGESERTEVKYWTKKVSQEIGEKLVLPASEDQGIQVICIEMFYLNSTLNFGIPPVLIFQLEVYYKVDRLLTGLTAQQKGTTAQWYSNKTSLFGLFLRIFERKKLYQT